MAVLCVLFQYKYKQIQTICKTHAARSILTAKFTTPSGNMFKELKRLRSQWYSVQYRCTGFQAMNDLTPDYLNNIFMRVSDTHDRNLRSLDNVELGNLEPFILKTPFRLPV